METLTFSEKVPILGLEDPGLCLALPSGPWLILVPPPCVPSQALAGFSHASVRQPPLRGPGPVQAPVHGPIARAVVVRCPGGQCLAGRGLLDSTPAAQDFEPTWLGPNQPGGGVGRWLQGAGCFGKRPKVSAPPVSRVLAKWTGPAVVPTSVPLLPQRAFPCVSHGKAARSKPPS